jgi:type IV pilus assembly protein PilF
MSRVVAAVVAMLVVLGGCATSQAPLAEPPPREPSPDPADPDRRARARLELASAYFARGQNRTTPRCRR